MTAECWRCRTGGEETNYRYRLIAGPLYSVAAFLRVPTYFDWSWRAAAERVGPGAPVRQAQRGYTPPKRAQAPRRPVLIGTTMQSAPAATCSRQASATKAHRSVQYRNPPQSSSRMCFVEDAVCNFTVWDMANLYLGIGITFYLL